MGTSVTNTVVALTHMNNREDFQRGIFAIKKVKQFTHLI